KNRIFDFLRRAFRRWKKCMKEIDELFHKLKCMSLVHEKLVDSIPKDIYVYQDLMKDIPNRGKNLLENLSEKYKIVIPYHELFHCYPIYKLFYPLLKKIHEDILNKAYV